MSKGPYGRRDRSITERRHDPYRERRKWPEPTLCSQCRAVFASGRWGWLPEPDQAHKTVCPACRRIADNFPAGYVELTGPFLAEHYRDIMNLILNEEKREKNERPLERIITIVGGKTQASVTTTGVHIARRIGDALARAYGGELSVRYAEASPSIRVIWQR